MKFQERRVGLLTNPEGCALLCLGVIYKICAFRGCQRPFVEDRWRPFRRVAKSLRLAVRYEVLMGRGLNHYHYRVEKWAMKWYWFSARNILWLSNSAAMESRPNCYNRTYDICPLRFRLGSAAISARSKNDPSASDGLREIKTSESPRHILKSGKWNQSITSLMCCFWDCSHFFMWLDWKESFCFEKLYLSRAESEVFSFLGSRKRL